MCSTVRENLCLHVKQPSTNLPEAYPRKQSYSLWFFVQEHRLVSRRSSGDHSSVLERIRPTECNSETYRIFNALSRFQRNNSNISGALKSRDLCASNEYLFARMLLVKVVCPSSRHPDHSSQVRTGTKQIQIQRHFCGF